MYIFRILFEWLVIDKGGRCVYAAALVLPLLLHHLIAIDIVFTDLEALFYLYFLC